MALTAQQRIEREGKLTASAVGCLMTGNETKIMNLWREMIGDPSYEPENLDDVWPVQLGSETEALNLRWYTKKTGRPLTRIGHVIVHQNYPWAAATLDGFDEEIGAVVECKHVGGRESLDTVKQRYMPQVHWQVMCCKHIGATQAAFSIIEGSQAPKVDLVPFDEGYAATLWERAVHFMKCVDTMTPPFAVEGSVAPPPTDSSYSAGPVAPPPPAKEYDMTGQNEWADYAATWLANYEAADKADDSEKAIKLLMPKDAKRSHGHGVEIVRDRGGKLKLRQAA